MSAGSGLMHEARVGGGVLEQYTQLTLPACINSIDALAECHGCLVGVVLYRLRHMLMPSV